MTTGERERAVVPRAEPRSYYGRPVIKEPVWTWEIPVYFFLGGMAGASTSLAYLSELTGNRVLARRSWSIGVAACAAGPPLLISDLGRPARFLNMFRVFKITSPMSVGSWLLGAVASTAVVSAADSVLGLFPRLALAAKPTAVATGLPLATYTAALISNTSVPVWSEARMTLPFVFASGAAASAGAAAVLVTPEKHAGPARRLAVGGAIAELGSTRLMEERLGDELASPYHEGAAGASSRAAQLLTAAGGMVLGGWGRGRRRAAAAGAGMIMAGALLERWAVYKAGFQSAADPKHTVAPQRRRIEQGETPGASRRAGQAKP